MKGRMMEFTTTADDQAYCHKCLEAGRGLFYLYIKANERAYYCTMCDLHIPFDGAKVGVRELGTSHTT